MKSILPLSTRTLKILRLTTRRQLIFIVLLFMFLTPGALAQTKKWDKRFGGPEEDRLTTMAATADGGYLLGGTSYFVYYDVGGDKTDRGSGYDDYWVVRIAANGEKLWDKAFGGGENDNLTAILPTADGGFLLGGYSSSGSGFSSDKSEDPRSCEPTDDFCYHDYWIIKIDANGNKLWDKTYGGIGGDVLYSMVATPDGGFLLGGVSDSSISGDKTSPNKGEADSWIIKIDANGNKIWDKTYGGSNGDGLTNIIATTDGNFLLGGGSNSGISGDKTQTNRGFSDYWVVKISGNGDILWDKTFGGESYDDLTALVEIADGSYLLGGESTSIISGDKTDGNAENMDLWVVKIDVAGNKIWDKAYGSIHSDIYDNIADMVPTPSGGFMLAGSIYDTSSPDYYKYFYVRKMKADGTELLYERYGGDNNDILQALVATPDGNYLLGGYTYSGISGDVSEASRGDADYWVVKLQEKVPTFWNKRYGGKSIEILKTVVSTPDGGYLLGGHSLSRHGGDRSQDTQGSYDFWIVKTDAAGNQLWDKRYGGNDDDYLNGIVATPDGGYLLAGSSKSGLGGDKSQPSRGGQDFWIVKINSGGTKQWDRRYGGNGFDDLKSLIQLSSGEFILAGESDSAISGDKSQNRRGSRDYWIIKITNNGTKLWDKRYGGTRSEALTSIISTGYDYLLGGKSASGIGGDKTQASRGNYDYWVVRIDENGNKVWDKRFGGTGDDELVSMGEFAFGEVFIGGTSTSGATGDKTQESQGGKDYWLLQLNDYGGQIWDKSFGGIKDDELHTVFLDNNGNYLLAGSSASDKSSDKSENSQGGKDYWMVQLDSYAGDKLWDRRFGGAGDDNLRYALHTADGAYLLAGYSASGISGDKSQNNQGRTDFWVAKVPNSDYFLFTNTAKRSESFPQDIANELYVNIQAFPNPFEKSINISFTLKKTQQIQLKVYNGQGQEVKSLYQGEAQANKKYQVEWKPNVQQATGLYFIKLHAKEHSSNKKIILNR